MIQLPQQTRRRMPETNFTSRCRPDRIVGRERSLPQQQGCKAHNQPARGRSAAKAPSRYESAVEGSSSGQAVPGGRSTASKSKAMSTSPSPSSRPHSAGITSLWTTAGLPRPPWHPAPASRRRCTASNLNLAPSTIGRLERKPPPRLTRVRREQHARVDPCLPEGMDEPFESTAVHALTKLSRDLPQPF